MTLDFNNNFRRLFVLYYVKSLAGIYIAVYWVIDKGFVSFNVYSQAINPLIVILVLFDIAAIGTTIVEKSRSIEKCIWRSYRHKMCRYVFWKFTEQMAHAEVKDSLRISDVCIYEQSVIFACFETMLPCLAILLQFDYRIMAKFVNKEDNNSRQKM